MDLMFTNENKVVKGKDMDGASRWMELSAHDFHKLLNPEIDAAVLESYFPGCGYYGPLVGRAEADDMLVSLDVLRATKELHALLEGCDSLIRFEKNDSCTPSLSRIDSIESIAAAHLRQIESVLSEHKCIEVTLGKGYEEPNDSDPAVPWCHILHASITLPEAYARWAKQRIDIYKALGNAIRSSRTYYLNMHNSVTFDAASRKIEIDVFGSQALNEEWDEWLKQYFAILPNDLTVSAVEEIAGLRHLADTLATIHLTTSTPYVDNGVFARFGAQDSLTDLWRRCYDIATDANYSIGACEVCGRLFIGSHKKKRGHEACMNRQRVSRSRAKKYAKSIESGLSPSESSRRAGISSEAAIPELKKMRHDFLKQFDYQ